jgi:hypothetical protein
MHKQMTVSTHRINVTTHGKIATVYLKCIVKIVLIGKNNLMSIA